MNVVIPLPGLPPETPPATRITLEKFQKNIRILLLNQETLNKRRSKDKKNMEVLKQLVDTKNLLLRITAAQRQLCSNLTFYLLENFAQKYPTQKSLFEEKKQENISIKSTDVTMDETDIKEKKRKKKRKTPTPEESEEEDELDEKFLLYMIKDGPFSPTYRGHTEAYQSHYPTKKEKENDDYNKISIPRREESAIEAINKENFLLHYGLLTPNQFELVTSLLEENTKKKARKRTITSLPVYSNKKFRYKIGLPVNVFDPPQLQPRKTRQSTASARASPSRHLNRSSPSGLSMVSSRDSPSNVSARASPSRFAEKNSQSTSSTGVISEKTSCKNMQIEPEEDRIDGSDLTEEHKEMVCRILENEQLEDSESSDESDEEEIPIMERTSKRQQERGNIKREIQKGTWEKYKKREEKNIKKKK